jgi:hypothetical protein
MVVVQPTQAEHMPQQQFAAALPPLDSSRHKNAKAYVVRQEGGALGIRFKRLLSEEHEVFLRSTAITP